MTARSARNAGCQLRASLAGLLDSDNDTEPADGDAMDNWASGAHPNPQPGLRPPAPWEPVLRLSSACGQPRSRGAESRVGRALGEQLWRGQRPQRWGRARRRRPPPAARRRRRRRRRRDAAQRPLCAGHRQARVERRPWVMRPAGQPGSGKKAAARCHAGDAPRPRPHDQAHPGRRRCAC